MKNAAVYLFMVGEDEIMLIPNIGIDIVTGSSFKYFPEFFRQERICFLPPPPEMVGVEKWHAAKPFSEGRRQEVLSLYC